jgi:hypothetical protein
VQKIDHYWLFIFILLGCCYATPGRAEEESALYTLHRDPFDFSEIRPPARVIEPEVNIEEQAITLELRATMISKQHSLANLNGKIIGEGEEVEGYRLLKISEDEVVLEKDGKQVTVSME